AWCSATWRDGKRLGVRMTPEPLGLELDRRSGRGARRAPERGRHGRSRIDGMSWLVYLSGEIHTDWRERIEAGAREAGLDIAFTAPVTDHSASDDAGTAVLGDQGRPFWNDHIG